MKYQEEFEIEKSGNSGFIILAFIGAILPCLCIYWRI
jgi:hypothetical protein